MVHQVGGGGPVESNKVWSFSTLVFVMSNMLSQVGSQTTKEHKTMHLN